MNATRLLDNIHTRAKIEVVGICKNYLGLSLTLQVAMKDTLHCCRSAYRHKNRGLDCSVIGNNLARTSLALSVCML